MCLTCDSHHHPRPKPRPLWQRDGGVRVALSEQPACQGPVCSRLLPAPPPLTPVSVPPFSPQFGPSGCGLPSVQSQRVPCTWRCPFFLLRLRGRREGGDMSIFGGPEGWAAGGGGTHTLRLLVWGGTAPGSTGERSLRVQCGDQCSLTPGPLTPSPAPRLSPACGPSTSQLPSSAVASSSSDKTSG